MKRYLIKTIAQFYANMLYKILPFLSEGDFNLVYEQAAMLNAYCIVFHDIYLD